MEWTLLAGLTEPERHDVLRRTVRRRFGRREVIFHEGDAGDAVHLVVTGHVALRVTTPRGDAALIDVVGPGAFLGELVLLADGPRAATALAIEPVETMSLHRNVFDELRQRSPAVQAALDQVLVDTIRRATAALTDALFLPAKERLWRRVATVADTYLADSGAEVPLTQQEIAELVGLTRPTANRLLRDGEAAGAVRLGRGRFTILDRAWIDQQAGAG